MFTRLRQHAHPITLLAIALALIGYCTFLLRDIYRSHSQLLGLERERTLLEAEKGASALGYFFAERKEDLADLSHSRELLAFFENEALGMSMEYGLAATLEEATEAFGQFHRRKLLGKGEIYARVSFFSGDGRRLIDVSAPGWQSRLEDLGMLPSWLKVDGATPGFTLLPGAKPSLAIHQAYFFKGRKRGLLVTELPLEPAFKWFVGPGATHNPMALLIQNQWVVADRKHLGPTGALPDPGILTPRAFFPLGVASMDGRGLDLRAYRIPIPEVPFSLVAFIPTFKNQERSPVVMISVAGAIGAILLLGAFALFRGESRNRALNARFRAIFDNAGLAIALMDPHWRFQEVNGRFSRIFGFSEMELRKLRMEDLTHPEDARQAAIFRDAALSDPMDCATIEHRFLAKDGSELWGAVFTTTIRGRNDRVEAVVGIIIDRTEAKRVERERLSLEAQLRQAQKLEAVGQLAAGIAHEINTPIQYIGNNATFLGQSFEDVRRLVDAYVRSFNALHPPDSLLRGLEEAWSEADMDFLREEIPKSIRQIREGSDRVAGVVHALKEFAQPGGGVPEPVDLNRAVESTVVVSRNGWERVADLVLDLDPALPKVECFQDEMNQVILSLILNAADAIADTAGLGGGRGTITLSTRKNGDQVEVRVQDTGTGIPEAIRERIFDPFFTTKDVGKGTGQGLAIAYHVIVERHHGTLRFETHEGQGTVFVIRIPLRHEAARATDG